MRVLVFGTTGQVAHCLREEASSGITLLALSRSDAPLDQPGKCAAAIEEFQPTCVINAAAYTAVDKAAEDQATALAVNATAPAEMARAANLIGADFLHISTDYVFDGTADAPYTERDKTNPLNVYGTSKLDGEKHILIEHTGAIILRTSWVFSEFGNNFVKTMLRLAQTRDALSVVGDQKGGPTYARDIARTLLTIANAKASGKKGSGVYHYQGAPLTNWADFAANIFETAGKNIAVSSIATSDYPTPAARPLYTALDCSRIYADFVIDQPDWRTALSTVISTLTKGDDTP